MKALPEVQNQKPGRDIGTRKRACLALLGLLLIASLSRYGWACMFYQMTTVHFHSGSPDFGTPPRRAVLSWRGEHDDRPIKDDLPGEGPDDTEFSEALLSGKI